MAKQKVVLAGLLILVLWVATIVYLLCIAAWFLHLSGNL